MNEKDKGFKIVEHTADIGLKIFGKNKIELFINAARGMFFLITGSLMHNVNSNSKKYFTVVSEAINIEDLLINWLNDLLYIHSTELVLFDDYSISCLTDKVIRSTVRSISIKDSSYQVLKEIKAVTYHNIFVGQTGKDNWEANIVFDI